MIRSGEKAVGIGADTLMRKQTAYDLAQARAHEADLKIGKLVMAA